MPPIAEIHRCPHCQTPLRALEYHCVVDGVPCGWVLHSCGARMNSRNPNQWNPPINPRQD